HRMEVYHEEIDKNGDSIIVCDECPQKYSISTSTGVLAEHLNNKHNRGIILKSRRYLSSVQSSYGKDDITRIEEYENSILDFFVGDQISFNTAESQWDIYISPNQHVKDKIILRYEIQKSLVAKELKNLNAKVVLTTDIWTLSANQSYLNITIHFIDIKWKMKWLLLDLIHFESNHTAIRTREKLIELCRNMNISEKVIALTTDNHSAMILCGNLLERE
ncbi:38472_t:CDS:2, partial [Gigaspora margarita]